MSADSPQVDVSPEILDYLREQTSLTLATASLGGIPRATTLRYASDGLKIYVWMRSGATAAKHMGSNPVVSFAIDSEEKGLQGTGEVHPVLSGDEIASAVKLFTQKYAGLASGSQTTDISFFRIEPLNVKLVDETYAGGRGETQLGQLEYRQQAVYDAFRDLPEQTAAGITARLRSVHADAGDVIARAGAPADKFFIVVSGSVEVVPEGDDGAGEPITLSPGDFFGEMAVLRDTPRRATATATAPTELLALEREEFRALVAQSLGIPENFDSLLRERLGGGEQQ
ncbi:MAG: voltage-gated potassium channel [Solirubrobacteraceae bacterium]|nr:voltage-gated potassium channel [Solirubrobacteraceae bacterium]